MRQRSDREAQPSLAREAIALAGATCDLTAEVLDVVDSTSSELLRRAARSDVHRHVLVAESQTAGRGRRGARWTSLTGGSLTFSLAWRFEQGAGYLTGLPLAVGLGLAVALEEDSFKGIELKWPNDLIHRGAKLGGVLVELSGDAAGPSLAIIGIGLNVRFPRAARRAIAQPVTDLAAVAPERSVDRSALLARLLSEQVRVLEAYAAAGFAPMRAAWQDRHALHAKRVQVLLPDGRTVPGTVAGVDADGALVLGSAGKTLRLVSGEVSLRRP
jgi:BirA family biotin operon repressor/biotin-[acetyl-CoA-carboxylase] ligase